MLRPEPLQLDHQHTQDQYGGGAVELEEAGVAEAFRLESERDSLRRFKALQCLQSR